MSVGRGNQQSAVQYLQKTSHKRMSERERKGNRIERSKEEKKEKEDA